MSVEVGREAGVVPALVFVDGYVAAGHRWDGSQEGEHVDEVRQERGGGGLGTEVGQDGGGDEAGRCAGGRCMKGADEMKQPL